MQLSCGHSQNNQKICVNGHHIGAAMRKVIRFISLCSADQQIVGRIRLFICKANSNQCTHQCTHMPHTNAHAVSDADENDYGKHTMLMGSNKLPSLYHQTHRPSLFMYNVHVPLQRWMRSNEPQALSSCGIAGGALTCHSQAKQHDMRAFHVFSRSQLAPYIYRPTTQNAWAMWCDTFHYGLCRRNEHA